MFKIKGIDVGDFPIALAPMEDVSDPPFRKLCKELGADLMYTEFVSSEGLIRNIKTSVEKIDIYPDERPIGIQIYGNKPESMAMARKLAIEREPDLIDINYGCPVKKVANKGNGAGLLKDIPLMVANTRAVVQATHLPVTVKTRLGWDDDTIQIVEVALRLQDAGIQALTIHCRTPKQMYKGEADWSYIRQIKQHPDIEIPIVGNGDINTPKRALEYKNTYGVDAIMIGRAAIGNPWIFREVKHYLATGELLPPPALAERAALCKRHLQLSLEWKKERVAIGEMRKHYSNYFRAIPDFKPRRIALLQAGELDTIYDMLDEIGQLPDPSLSVV